MERFKHFLEYTIFELGEFSLHVFNIFNLLVIFLLARFVLWIIHLYFKRKHKEGKIDHGKKYAIIQLLTYLIYVIAIIVAVDSLGFKITVILAGSTALLVGLGLGLQDFFRDLVAGFIILSERTVTSGDIVEIGGIVGKVKDVGLRTTSLITREDIVMIVPNTRLTNEHVINWSQNNSKVTRFEIRVNVAFGSDTQKVCTLLTQCAENHEDVMKIPGPDVLFREFEKGSLDFGLTFYSNNLFRIERTKSDLRFAIDKAFRENNIVIPFPQQDVWVRQFPQKEE
ncbi:mechanosensitive ion channel family protein [Owenweeksia hongkongensis]|uniref:Small-conductance mechanosensitive channel n=1 Tax=Owenweeksia hongkongensis (strain DSM 17368 / CIP 108786 / JCM 12287 / NRRL B-23963 / UST20020801) TaxID=926562 RepID=G8R2I5_OWEHD|nr:mechanosensitive ion channel domain-containing protein [Owenweeksia hongkongensis]AEV33997.1 small-conductance mechanosensitive channel [Owenweeksia hongkongensis DSM 17368]